MSGLTLCVLGLMSGLTLCVLGLMSGLTLCVLGLISGLTLCVLGLMSGLTLGLLSLDTTSLHVLQQAGTIQQQKHATKILPLVKKHHLLLVSLQQYMSTSVNIYVNKCQ